MHPCPPEPATSPTDPGRPINLRYLKTNPALSGRLFHSCPAWKFPAVGCFLLVGTGLIAYLNSFGCSFHFDDLAVVVHNPAVHDLSDWRGWLLFHPRRPVGFLSFALNYHWNGLDVWGYHLVNLILHLVNALLVWRLVSLLFRTPRLAGSVPVAVSRSVAFFTAWLFIAHPLMTEAVTYIAQRFVLLYSLFFLLSVTLFIKGLLSGRGMGRSLCFAGAVFSGVFSFFSKEPAYPLPLLWGVLWLFFFRDEASRPVPRRVLWSLLAIAGVIVAALSLSAILSGRYFGGIPPREGHPYSISPLQYYCTQLNVLVTYLRLIILPVNQTFDYNYPISSSLLDGWTTVSLLALSGLLTGSILLYRKHRLVSFGILWFFLTILPQSVVPRPNVIFEHRAYLSSVGIILIWVILVFRAAGQVRLTRREPGAGQVRLFGREPGAGQVRLFGRETAAVFRCAGPFLNLASLLLVVQVALFTWLTWQRNTIWKSELSLWTDCLEKAPGSARAWVNRGCALLEQKECTGAIVHFDQALLIFPRYLQALNNRGVARMTLHDYPGAVEDFTRAITLNRKFLEAWANRGIARRRAGRLDASAEDLTQAISLDTTRSDLYFQRGVTYWLAGLKERANTDISRSIAMGSREAERFYHTVMRR